MNQIVNYSEIELLTVTRKYTRCVELYTLVCGVLPNIKNVIWRIYLNSKESYESYSKDQHILWEQLRIRMLELAKNTGNIILFEELENMSVANVKGNYFATVGANGNRWVMSVDDDMLFPVLTLANLSYVLGLVRDPIGKLLLYSTVDVWNARGHADYSVAVHTITEALEMAQKYGHGVLPHLRIQSNIGSGYANYFMEPTYKGTPSFIPVNVGSGGFIVHPKAVPTEAINSMLNFNPHERGHDIQFASYFPEKYLICDCTVWHTGVEEQFFNDDWQTYNDEALKLYSSTTK